jgi:hypothetical protein
VQNLGEQRQRDHSSDHEESSPCSLCQAPKHVSEGSHREGRGGSSVASHVGRARNRLAGSCKRRVRIARRQEVACTLTDLRADEDELGVQLPRLDLLVRGRLTFGRKAFLGLKDRPLIRDDTKPVLEIERGFKGDSCHTASGYRRQASLT